MKLRRESLAKDRAEDAAHQSVKLLSQVARAKVQQRKDELLQVVAPHTRP